MCLTGVGDVCNNEVYHAHIPSNFKLFDIAILEMLNVFVAIKVWGKKWQCKVVSIQCHNHADVNILNNGKTRNLQLAAISRNIFMACAENDMELTVSHVMGKDNPVADLL